MRSHNTNSVQSKTSDNNSVKSNQSQEPVRADQSHEPVRADPVNLDKSSVKSDRSSTAKSEERSVRSGSVKFVSSGTANDKIPGNQPSYKQGNFCGVEGDNPESVKSGNSFEPESVSSEKSISTAERMPSPPTYSDTESIHSTTHAATHSNAAAANDKRQTALNDEKSSSPIPKSSTKLDSGSPSQTNERPVDGTQTERYIVL